MVAPRRGSMDSAEERESLVANAEGGAAEGEPGLEGTHLAPRRGRFTLLARNTRPLQDLDERNARNATTEEDDFSPGGNRRGKRKRSPARGRSPPPRAKGYTG